MLPKQNRLRHTREFSRARRSGRPSKGSMVALYVLRTRTSDIRVGFSVSKRVGNSVVRNRVKRLMRESVRRYLPMASAGVDLVFIARPSAATVSFAEMDATIRDLLRRSGAAQIPNETVDNA